MPKYAELAKALEAADEGMLGQVIAALQELDGLIDKRFQAFDEVVQSQGDMLEEIEEKLEQLVCKKMPADYGQDIAAIQRVLAEVKAKPTPKFDIDLSPIERSMVALNSRISMVEKEQGALQDMMQRLLTAKRVPEFDLNGNVIAVRLEA